MNPEAVMGRDIFEFWADVPGNALEHPADRVVLNRVAHSFHRACLPGPFKGRLRTAPIVLLFLSPGFRDDDLVHAASPEGQEYYARSRTGMCDLPSPDEHPGSFGWSARIVRQFGIDYETARAKIAFLNISPYQSATFDDPHMLSALPWCRAALDWAQSVRFAQAEAGERVVVCLRSARHWGLEPGRAHSGTLLLHSATETALCFTDHSETKWPLSFNRGVRLLQVDPLAP